MRKSIIGFLSLAICILGGADNASADYGNPQKGGGGVVQVVNVPITDPGPGNFEYTPLTSQPVIDVKGPIRKTGRFGQSYLDYTSITCEQMNAKAKEYGAVCELIVEGPHDGLPKTAGICQCIDLATDRAKSAWENEVEEWLFGP
jgi:hypothetical protein